MDDKIEKIVMGAMGIFCLFLMGFVVWFVIGMMNGSIETGTTVRVIYVDEKGNEVEKNDY